jgi:hypothetical protein
MGYAAGTQSDLIGHLSLVPIEDNQITTSTGLQALSGFDPASFTSPLWQAFTKNCLFCHISAEPLTGSEYTRLTGCAACHIQAENQATHQPIHHLITAIPYQQCNTCHNRGTYNVNTATFTVRGDQPANRQQDVYLPNTHVATCEFRLDCVDCHTRQEIMGDGDLHSNQVEIQYVQCRTCHGTLTELPLTRTITEPTDFALTLAALNPAVRLQVGDTILVTAQGESLWNTHVLTDGTYELVDKATGQHLTFRPIKGSSCQQNVEQQKASDCHACHSTKP